MDKKSVLVVDDEEIIRDFLFEVLNDDFEVSTASDGDEAINMLKESNFDLVITDLKMPRVSGDEVVKFARQTDPDAKVIFKSLLGQQIGEPRRQCVSVQALQHQRADANRS